jgi:hypothetical protein
MVGARRGVVFKEGGPAGTLLGRVPSGCARAKKIELVISRMSYSQLHFDRAIAEMVG